MASTEPDDVAALIADAEARGRIWHEDQAGMTWEKVPPLKFNMESAPGKGDSLWNSSFSGFMLNFKGDHVFKGVRISFYLVVSRWFHRQGLGDMKAQIVGVNYSGVTWSHRPKWWFARGILAMTQHADLWRWARYDSKVTQVISYITHDSIPVLWWAYSVCYSLNTCNACRA